MRKAACSIILCLSLCCSFALPAAAASTDGLAGWELWQSETRGGYTALTCPIVNADTDEILAAVSKLIAEYQAERRAFIVTFRYTREHTSFSALVNRMLLEVTAAVGGVWPCGNSYAYVSISAERTPSYEYRLHVRVETNGAYDPDGKLTAAFALLAELASEAKALDGQREQLVFLDRELSERISYDAETEPYSLYEAMVNGRAACTGYAVVVQTLCRCLEIPCVTIKNSHHAWNSVFVDGGWKHWDVTWSDGGTGEYLLVDFLNDTTSSHSYDADVLTSDHTLARERMAYYVLPARFAAARDYLAGKGLTNTGENGAVTRGELAQLLAALDSAELDSYDGSGIFTDVPDEFAACVDYCYAVGLMMGCGAGIFQPDAPVTPEAACTVVLRWLGIGTESTDWSYGTAYEKAVAAGLVSEHFFTGPVVTRGELSYLLHVAVTF